VRRVSRLLEAVGLRREDGIDVPELVDEEDPAAGARDAIEWLHQLCADLDVAPLSQFGFAAQDIPVVVAQAQKASSMKGNPIALTEEELWKILAEAA